MLNFPKDLLLPPSSSPFHLNQASHFRTGSLALFRGAAFDLCFSAHRVNTAFTIEHG